MSKTYDKIADVFVQVCGVDRDKLLPTDNLIDDHGVDSIDFLDATYELDQFFGIKLPVASWVEKINAGEANSSDYFVIEKLTGYIDSMVAEKAAI